MGTRRKLRKRTAKQTVQINNKADGMRVKDVVQDRHTLDFIGLWQKKMNPKVVALYDKKTKLWGLLLFHANCVFKKNSNNCVNSHIHMVQNPGNAPLLLVKSRNEKNPVDTGLFASGKALYKHVVETYGDLLAQTD